jgi:crossover junction endodeoxyribonuclease RuvC
MRIVGIDPGLSGGLALVDGGALIECVVAPTVVVKAAKREYDADALVALFRRFSPDHVFLEKAQAMPGQGVSSMFSIGLGYGLYRGILAALKIPYTLTHPKSWQKVMFMDLPKGDTKAMGHIVCMRLWPGRSWLASERCKKVHDGLTDASLIAAYGCRTLAGDAPVFAAVGGGGRMSDALSGGVTESLNHE